MYHGEQDSGIPAHAWEWEPRPTVLSVTQNSDGRARCTGLLAETGCEQLSGAQHRALLCHLANECLDKEPLRLLLSHRLDSAEGVKKHLREGLASDRVKLKVGRRALPSLFLHYFPRVGALSSCACTVQPSRRLNAAPFCL